MSMTRQRIAVVGSGIAGCLAAHVLATRHDVNLFEADTRVGGHTHTVDVEVGGRRLAIDTGFIVYNERTYPIFTRLLERLGVATQPSSMSFSVRDEATGFEYCGTSLNTLFAQRGNLLRPSFWGMLKEILRFNREALALLEQVETAGGDESITLGAFLVRGRYSERFVRHYLVPMGAAVWSTAPGRMFGFPAVYFARFFHNHGFLTVDDRPQWRVIRGGSRSYLEKLVAPYAERIRCGSPVVAVARHGGHVELTVRGAAPERFDAVVLACHSDQALKLLVDPSEAEREVLAAIPYQANSAVLHTDTRLLPKRPRARAAWNYHLDHDGERATTGATLTYDMNVLQSLETDERYLVTLNRDAAIDPARVLRRMVYHHPLYTPAGVAAQARHAEISGVRRTYYCGAYWRYGFHEDGCLSAVTVARQFGLDFA